MCDAQNPNPLPLPSRDTELDQQRSLATLQGRLESDTEVLSWKALQGRAAERDGYALPIDRPPRAA